jgi:hypothetical protein
LPATSFALARPCGSVVGDASTSCAPPPAGSSVQVIGRLAVSASANASPTPSTPSAEISGALADAPVVGSRSSIAAWDSPSAGSELGETLILAGVTKSTRRSSP